MIILIRKFNFHFRQNSEILSYSKKEEVHSSISKSKYLTISTVSYSCSYKHLNWLLYYKSYSNKENER